MSAMCGWLCCCTRNATSSSVSLRDTPAAQRNDANNANSAFETDDAVPNRRKESSVSISGLDELRISYHLPDAATAPTARIGGQNSVTCAKNGRKISPIGQGVQMVKDGNDETATISFPPRAAAVFSAESAKLPMVANASTSSSPDDFATPLPNGGKRRCPSVQTLQESFQKFTDFCSTAFGVTQGGPHLRPIPACDTKWNRLPINGLHKLSLNQPNDTSEKEAALAKRATKSLPATARPHKESLLISEKHLLGKLMPKLASHLETVEGDPLEYEAALTASASSTTTPPVGQDKSARQMAIQEVREWQCASEVELGSPTPTPVPVSSSSSSSPDLSSSLFFEMLEIAASNPDLINFQLTLNDWLKKQTGIIGSAFIFSSLELNVSYCQVCGGNALKDPIICGDWNLLNNIFTSQFFVKSENRRLSPLPFQCGKEGDAATTTPLVFNVDTDLSLPANTNLKAVVAMLIDAKEDAANTAVVQHRELNVFKGNCNTSSMIEITARCGFKAALLVVHRSTESRRSELNSILPNIPMISTLMSIVENVEEQKRVAQQSEQFLSMTQNVFSSLQDMNLLVRNITKEAKALVQAEICSLFLLDREHGELVAEVFEKNGISDEYLTEIRMPLSQGIVGHVAVTGKMANVKDVYNHPHFYPKVDERTGFITRNILCFPIKDSSGNLVGVAELCNKIGRDSFTRHDEQIASTFAVYCAISISHCLLYRKLQEAHRRSHMAAELLVQGSTLSIAPEDILRLTVRDIPSPASFHPDYNEFSFIPRSIGTGDIYVEAALSMFFELGFIERYRLRRRTLARFLLMVQKGYRDVPYHNWSHAFSVGHFCYLLIRMPAVQEALTDLERFALLVACLCHDIDHRGTTNAFQLQSKTPLAQLYSSEGSVLERHHFAQTVTILGMGMYEYLRLEHDLETHLCYKITTLIPDECNIFEQLTRQQYQTVLDSIREIILATDIAAHLRKVEFICDMVKAGYDSSSTDHHYLLTCLLMTASDLSDQCKDFKNSKAIAESIYKEFFSQGDLEKQMGNSPIEMMDRERACVPRIQLEFMDTVALPVFDYLSLLLPDLNSTYEALLLNRFCWQTLETILDEEGLPSGSKGSLEYLRNSELERRVMEKVKEEKAVDAHRDRHYRHHPHHLEQQPEHRQADILEQIRHPSQDFSTETSSTKR